MSVSNVSGDALSPLTPTERFYAELAKLGLSEDDLTVFGSEGDSTPSQGTPADPEPASEAHSQHEDPPTPPTLDEPRGPFDSGITTVKGDPRVLLVPEQDPDELTTGLPLRGKKLTPIPVPDGITPRAFRLAVIAAYAEYVMAGAVTLDGVAGRSGLHKPLIARIIATYEFRKAVETRGVLLPESFTGLSEAQDLFLAIYLDPFDGLTMSQKLKKAGVSSVQYRAWLRNPVFAEQVRRGADQILHSSDEAVVQLSRKAGEGDLNAIKFLFEVNGKYNPHQQQAIDVVMIMQGVLESLSRHVKDPSTLLAVSQDLKEIADNSGVTNALTSTIEG